MPIAWAATFDTLLVQRAASEIADEMRSFSNWEMRQGRPPAATNCYGPHVHVVRDPRWGRLAETYGEGEARGCRWMLPLQRPAKAAKQRSSQSL